MTSEEVEKIVKNLPDDMKDVLLNGLNKATNAMYDFADYMRENFVPVPVIEDIKAEIQETIDTTPYRYRDYEDGRIDAYEDCLEIIDKHISGGDNNG